MSAIGSGVRMPATTSSPWASTRNSPHSPARRSTGLRVKATPVPESVAFVPEDHLDDVHSRAQVVRDAVGAPVDLRARRVPRVEDGPDRALELVAGVLRERLARVLGVDLEEATGQLAQVGDVELDVLRYSAVGLESRELALEELAVDARHDVPEHLDEPPVGIEREALVPRRPGKALDGLVVQAQVENRVHHPGHRDRRTGTHRDEERIA